MGTRFSKASETNFIFMISGLFLLLTFFVIRDIFALIVYSFILSYFLFPLYEFYLEKTQHKRISSLLTLLTVTIGVFIPIILLSYFLILNMIKIVVQYKFYIENPEVLNEIVSNFLQTVTDSSILTNVSFSNLLTPIVSFIIDTSNNFFSSIPKTVFYFFIVLFISYYVLIFNKKILNVVNVYLPLGLKKQNEILINVTKNIRILFKGYFLTAIIQTGVAFLGYLAFGVPNILLITFVTLILSLIPYLGTPIVWVPLGFYLILIGEEIAGIGLLIYGTFVISMIDNFLRPVLMSDKETLSPPVVFVGFIGGMIAFGIEGLILGPMILSVTVIFLRYLKEAYEIKVDGE